MVHSDGDASAAAQKLSAFIQYAGGGGMLVSLVGGCCGGRVSGSSYLGARGCS